MSPEVIVALAIASFLIMIAIEVPIALAIGGSGLLAIALLADPSTAGSTLAATPYSTSAKYALVVIPMYVLLGSLISHAGLGSRIFSAVNRLVRGLPGGLAATTVGATAIFSGISGSSAADVATFGRIAVREMSGNGYSRQYAAAVVAAAGAFAALIPPSVTIILYAIIAEQSVSAMIMAGVLPGILSAVFLAVVVIVQGARRKAAAGAPAPAPALVTGSMSVETDGSIAARTSGAVLTAPAPPRGTAGSETQGTESLSSMSSGLRDDMASLVYAGILFLVVVGGLYGGMFTATEAGAIGAFAALVIAIIARRRREISVHKLIWRSVIEASQVTSMIFLLLIGGAIFSYALALSGVPRELSMWVADLDVPPKVVVALMLLLLLPLGAFLDGLSILLIAVPVMAPIAGELGFDGVWFGILVLKLVEIGLITPPVGVNAFIISAIADVEVEKVLKALLPFVVLDLVFTAVLFAFPALVLWLPRVAGVA